jgi:hypothetical protein
MALAESMPVADSAPRFVPAGGSASAKSLSRRRRQAANAVGADGVLILAAAT